jgi:hypothetical protein
MKRKQYKKELTDEDIKGIRFRDLIGIASDAELQILKERNIPSFMLHTIPMPEKPAYISQKAWEYNLNCMKKHQK